MEIDLEISKGIKLYKLLDKTKITPSPFSEKNNKNHFSFQQIENKFKMLIKINIYILKTISNMQ